MYYNFVNTPAGTLLFTGDGRKITGIHWQVYKRTLTIKPNWVEDKTVFEEAIQQLEEYFARKRKSFTFAHQAQGTPFQKSVWNKLAKLPYAAHTSYKKIASAIGNPKAVRAVGTAVGSNPICIVVPCHRVLGSDGRMSSGYAGGVKSKATLLNLEKIPYHM